MILPDVPIHAVPALEDVATKLAGERLAQVKSITMVLKRIDYF